MFGGGSIGMSEIIGEKNQQIYRINISQTSSVLIVQICRLINKH
ncbi:hypothetical protein Lepto7376_0450 [[Leptolyngbya] sp. PCC 7376]|nr:hypothetical protein Lepto7376_0450 [[Leptolyngbya] sp. PCC 7376]